MRPPRTADWGKAARWRPNPGGPQCSSCVRLWPGLEPPTCRVQVARWQPRPAWVMRCSLRLNSLPSPCGGASLGCRLSPYCLSFLWLLEGGQTAGRGPHDPCDTKTGFALCARRSKQQGRGPKHPELCHSGGQSAGGPRIRAISQGWGSRTPRASCPALCTSPAHLYLLALPWCFVPVTEMPASQHVPVRTPGPNAMLR